jgi:uncharacterized protein YkwD
MGLLALGACGGGGGGDAGADSGTALSSSAPLFSAPRAASAPVASGDAATDALNAANYIRARIGLSAFSRSAQLDQSALRHSTYYGQNGSSGPGALGFHTEAPNLPGFSGVTVTDRARAAGYPGAPMQENMSIGTNSGGGAALGLTAAPYHRINMLSCHADVGIGVVNRIYTLDFGGVAPHCGPADNQLVAYPFPEQTDVPIGTHSQEVPNPMPDIAARQVGYPISLLGAPGTTVTLSSLTVTDSNGSSIPGRIVGTNTETGAPLGNYVFFMPLPGSSTGMYEWNTTYIVRAIGSFNGNPFALTWRFTTASL